MKDHPWPRASIPTPVLVGIGFGIGGTIQCLFLLPWRIGPSVIGMGVVGAIGGAFLAYGSTPRRSLLRGAISYSLGFMLGGFVSLGSLIGYLEGEISLPFHDFYLLFILGFCIAGATGAALAGPPLPVRMSAICFLVGGAVGGAAIAILSGSPMERRYIAAIGLLISEVVGGVASARALEFSDSSIDEGSS